MKSPRYNSHHVLVAALKVCPALSDSSPLTLGRIINWGPIIKRMKVLVKANQKEAKMLSTFVNKFGENLHDNKQLALAVNGEWMELLSKILNVVVSPETKKKRLNCAVCDSADFPVLLVVIQVMALGAPSQMWGTPEFKVFSLGGLPNFDVLFKSPEPPASHQAIADKAWYLPQLAMLVTSIWPVELGLEYYEATMCHILNTEEDDNLEVDTGMVNPEHTIGLPD